MNAEVGQTLAIAAVVIGLLAIWEFIRRRKKKIVNNPVVAAQER